MWQPWVAGLVVAAALVYLIRWAVRSNSRRRRVDAACSRCSIHAGQEEISSADSVDSDGRLPSP